MSIASVIAMSGDKIIMSPGSMIAIHRPSYAAGTVIDMEKAKDVLMKIEEGITPIYAKRTGLSDEKITELEAGNVFVVLSMRSETPEKQQDESVQNVIGKELLHSVSAVTGRCQANAEPVEQIKAKQRRRQLRRRSRPKT